MYPEDQFHEHTSFPVNFEAKEIGVSIPEDGAMIDSEWQILPLHKPVVRSLIAIQLRCIIIVSDLRVV